MFSFGIEHEAAFLNRRGQFVDFRSTLFAELEAIVAQLPLYEGDYPQLRVGDARIKHKRWYVEGFERYDETGVVIDCPPKGIEIRTTIHTSIQGAVQELTESFQLLAEAAACAGFVPALISFHPYCTEFVPDPPLNNYERQRKQQSPEKQTAVIPILTQGPDLNLSCEGMTTDEVIDAGRKLTSYSPYIVPFSFSSPFYAGELWDGLSVRTFVRTGVRPSALVFLARSEELMVSNPSLTKIARIPAEAGRIEFKACDSCADFTLYAALLALLKGLILDSTLVQRATVPDAALHQLSARHGFAHPEIAAGARAVLRAVECALEGDEDRTLLAPLHAMLSQRTTPAHELIRLYRETGSIETTARLAYTSQR
ncbi:MAG: glutamate--cysteine ligase [Ktedonobacteraceae bacterium]|nr:glutamate--cysteine ligase [Ktedonobacteraceae bacterium]